MTLSIDSPVVMLRLEAGTAVGHAKASDPDPLSARIEQLIIDDRLRDAICETARVYGPHLHRFFARWTSVDAEDAVQDTLLKAYESLRRGLFDRRGRYVAWLFKIAANLRKERFRKSKRRDSLLMLNRGAVEARSMAGEAAPPDEQVATRRAMERLREVVDQLSEADQSLLALRFAAGLSWQNVASVLGIKPETAKVRGMRLRRKLAEEMTP